MSDQLRAFLYAFVKWGSLVAAVAILGSCTIGAGVTAFSGNLSKHGVGGGILSGVSSATAAFVGAALVAVLLFGSIFLLLLVKDELAAIRGQLERLVEKSTSTPKLDKD